MRKREDGKDSQTVAKNAYNSRNYDRIAVQVYKGEKEKLKTFCEKNGETINNLINRLLANEIQDFIPIDTKNQITKKNQTNN